MQRHHSLVLWALVAVAEGFCSGSGFWQNSAAKLKIVMTARVCLCSGQQEE